MVLAPKPRWTVSSTWPLLAIATLALPRARHTRSAPCSLRPLLLPIAIPSPRSSTIQPPLLNLCSDLTRLFEPLLCGKEQDTLKEDDKEQRKIETQGKLDQLSSARTERQRKIEREIRDEFHLKSSLESLKWQVSVKKNNPDTVRGALGGIHCPIPPI